MSSLFEAYITNLGKYNEGRLVGETLKFPATTEEVQALLKRIGVDGVRYEEIFITSFDGDVLGLCDSYKRQKRRNGECSLDTDPGFEADVLRQPMTPDEHIEARETTFALYDALAQLPPTQARRVYQHYLLGMSKAEIAAAEGVGRSRICCSIERGLASMKNILKKSL